MLQFVNLHFEKQEKLTDDFFLKSNSQPPSPEPVLFVVLCTSCLGVESCGPCKGGVSRGCTRREGVSLPLGCLVVGVKLWFPFSLLWQSLRPPWKIRQARLEPGPMVQTQENSSLCLSALRTRWGLSGPALKQELRLQTDGGVRCWRQSASGLRAVGSCSAVTCQCLPWGAGADGPVSPEGPGAGRQDALCVRGLGRRESGCVPSASPHPHSIGAPPCRLEGPQGSQSSSSPFLSGKAASVLGHWD